MKVYLLPVTTLIAVSVFPTQTPCTFLLQIANVPHNTQKQQQQQQQILSNVVL